MAKGVFQVSGVFKLTESLMRSYLANGIGLLAIRLGKKKNGSLSPITYENTFYLNLLGDSSLVGSFSNISYCFAKNARPRLFSSTMFAVSILEG